MKKPTRRFAILSLLVLFAIDIQAQIWTLPVGDPQRSGGQSID